MKGTKKQKGITLVALIITIIVLLILAVVAIRAIQGNGIIVHAKNAKSKSALEALKEEVSLVLDKRQIDDAVESKIGLKEDLEQGISGDKIIETVNNLTDMYYVTRDNITITVYENGDIVEEKVDVWDGGSSESPEFKDFNWYIYNAKQLKFLADFVNNANALTEEQKVLVAEKGYNESDITITNETIVNLMANIDLGARQNNGNLIQGTAWTPIGKDSNRKYLGTFEGNHYSISGIYIDQTENFAGFFGDGRSSTIQNCTIKNSYILGGNCMGGLIGIGNVIEGCHNINTTVIQKEGNYYALGGIAGQASIVNNSTNSGKVINNGGASNSNAQCGGITGQLLISSSYCINNGDVIGNGIGVAGIAGLTGNSVNISNCTNNGRITGNSSYVAGIVAAMNNAGDINNCTNNGTIIGKGSYIGGIAGIARQESTISHCINNGIVQDKGERVGGIIGQISNSTTVTNCINHGDIAVEGTSVGGITGIHFGTIEKCYNTGTIKMIKLGGGFAGICGQIGTKCKAVIINCYNIGKVIVEKQNSDEIPNAIAGIVGWISETETSGIISNNYNVGKLEMNNQNVSQVGPIVGRITENGKSQFTRANNYYIEGTYKTEENTEGESKIETEMRSQTLVDLLNTGLETPVWELKANEAYPTIIGI